MIGPRAIRVARLSHRTFPLCQWCRVRETGVLATHDVRKQRYMLQTDRKDRDEDRRPQVVALGMYRPCTRSPSSRDECIED